ncbi:pikachurin isoform X2 [Clupea harengus]|uniref:Pikachurin isoform X2 n=1 Tax=Clupea harengus TaxID=7950 RepID=A0A6P8EFF3_CLUHA|nr:pikachurin isoform X2 [Clupea harengus]
MMAFSLCRATVILLMLLQMVGFSCSLRRTADSGLETLSPPLDVELETLNCTAVAVRWRVPRRHVTAVMGYRVFLTEVKNNSPVGTPIARNMPLRVDMLRRVPWDGLVDFSMEVSNLKNDTQYHVTIAAYGWAGEGRPSMPRDIMPASHERCLRPASPSAPHVVAASHTEIVLSWKPGPTEGASPVQQFLVSYTRPEVDSEWTSLRVPVQTNSMVLRGLSPDTLYQFMVQAVNSNGASDPSSINGIWTLSIQEAGSGALSKQRLIHPIANDEAVIVDYDYRANTEELSPSKDFKKPQVTSRPEAPASQISGNVWRFAPLPAVSTPSDAPSDAPSGTTLGPPLPPSAPMTQWRGALRRLYDLPCEDTVCPSHTICVDDHASGGSRCQCSLGRGGQSCSEVVAVQFPRLYGDSYMAFDPLKNSFHSFQISLEFKADNEDGLLFYCGENEHGYGDFASLALYRGKLHFRYNCGTGAAHLVSERGVVTGQWHSVSVNREGTTGWLRLDNHTPTTGQSQGTYTKITFRTPLYVGGTPNGYWLARAAGTNRGFQGCLQSLSVNRRVVDMRPWPLGRALSGADVGECSDHACSGVFCANGGTCFSSQADAHICLCPLGYRGPLCQEKFWLSVPHFNESLLSYASAPWPHPQRHYLSFTEFEITFRPSAPHGTLLYCQDANSSDFLSVTLVDGHVEFRFDCGSGAAVLRSEEAVSLFSWHEARASRTARKGILQVDSQRTVEGMADGAFTQIRCSSPLYLGGVPDYSATRRDSGVPEPFTGSIQQVLLNDHVIPLTASSLEGVNVGNAEHPCGTRPCANAGSCQPRADQYQCDCPIGFHGNHCQKVVTEDIEVPLFTGRSYLKFDRRNILKRLSGLRTHVQLRFRCSAPNGLLLWRGEGPGLAGADFMSLALQGGALIFSFDLGSGLGTVVVNGTFNDGRWHQLKAVRDGQYGRLVVNGQKTGRGQSPGRMRQLNSNGPLYIGGMKQISLHTHRQYMRGLVGCISHLSLSANFHISLMEEASDGKNIDTCLE